MTADEWSSGEVRPSPSPPLSRCERGKEWPEVTAKRWNWESSWGMAGFSGGAELNLHDKNALNVMNQFLQAHIIRSKWNLTWWPGYPGHAVSLSKTKDWLRTTTKIDIWMSLKNCQTTFCRILFTWLFTYRSCRGKSTVFLRPAGVTQRAFLCSSFWTEEK